VKARLRTSETAQPLTPARRRNAGRSISSGFCIIAKFPVPALRVHKFPSWGGRVGRTVRGWCIDHRSLPGPLQLTPSRSTLLDRTFDISPHLLATLDKCFLAPSTTRGGAHLRRHSCRPRQSQSFEVAWSPPSSALWLYIPAIWTGTNPYMALLGYKVRTVGAFMLRCIYSYTKVVMSLLHRRGWSWFRLQYIWIALRRTNTDHHTATFFSIFQLHSHLSFGLL